MDTTTKFILTAVLIVCSAAAGYMARRNRLVPETIAGPIMTLIVVFGYSSVGFFAIWSRDVTGQDAWLPTLGIIQAGIMAGLGILIAAMLGMKQAQRGLFGLSATVGNAGFTMGGFLLFLMYGERGLALASIYCLMWYPMVVFLLYPVGRHYCPGAAREPLWRLMCRSLFHWRSIGLPMMLGGLILSLVDVPYPSVISEWEIVEIIVFSVIILAYFSIGLRLRFSHLLELKRMILSLALVRFGLSTLVALGLYALTLLTPWGMDDVHRNVIIIEASVPMAVTNVAVANMFGLKPKEASMLFVANTGMYLVLVLPIIAAVFGG
ncbi:MAG: AEC family transporter [Phycisphaerae bacterium]